jgi:OCT family organic cation transporter-like MFS transporter 18
MSSKTEVTITYLNVILYALSYQLQRPIEPFLVRTLIHNSSHSSQHHTNDEESSTNQTYGRLTSFFSAIQTVGSPLVGILLDKIGVRSTSILVYTGSAASYAILAQASTLSGLYYSKIPTLLQHAFLVGQATVAVTTLDDSASRAAALGRMTTAYTVGATVGPALGGYLAEKSDLYAGARVAVWGSILSIVLSVVYLKDHHV